MENFKQIAEDCLAGKLSGTFVLRDGSKVSSNHLKKLNPSKNLICSYSLGECWISDNGNAYGNTGYLYGPSIKNFIPDMKKGQITIDIPEGKIPVMEQSEKGVIITWKEKELTYEDIKEKLSNDKKYIGNFGYNTFFPNLDTHAFYKKIEVLHRLVNIRNYFGKPDENHKGWIIEQGGIHRTIWEFKYNFTCIVFAKREHAEQAVKILGDELKYLFEPW